MFGGKKTENISSSGTPSASVVSNNMITVGTRIEGNVSASSDMRIDGD